MNIHFQDRDFNTYEELYHFLSVNYGRTQGSIYKFKIDSIKNELIKERHQKILNYWKSMDVKFNYDYDVPNIPNSLTKEEYDEIIIPSLIRCGAIPKKDLIDGQCYYGDYRNNNLGKWDKEKNKFIIWRSKFGNWILDDCNHFEDDDNFALFVPIKEVSEDVYNKKESLKL